MFDLGEPQPEPVRQQAIVAHKTTINFADCGANIKQYEETAAMYTLLPLFDGLDVFISR